MTKIQNLITIHSGYARVINLVDVFNAPTEKRARMAHYMPVKSHREAFIRLTRAQSREAFLSRQSYRTFDQEQISLDEFGVFLGSVSGLRLDELPFAKFRYPSAGNLYPVQVYLHVKPQRISGS